MRAKNMFSMPTYTIGDLLGSAVVAHGSAWLTGCGWRRWGGGLLGDELRQGLALLFLAGTQATFGQHNLEAQTR